MGSRNIAYYVTHGNIVYTIIKIHILISERLEQTTLLSSENNADSFFNIFTFPSFTFYVNIPEVFFLSISIFEKSHWNEREHMFDKLDIVGVTFKTYSSNADFSCHMVFQSSEIFL